MYANLRGLLDFLEAPYVLEVLEGAWNGLPARVALPAYVDDEAVLQAVRRVLADGIAVVSPAGEDLLHQVPRLTPRGRRLLEQLSQI
jgi:hypothetical protein